MCTDFVENIIDDYAKVSLDKLSHDMSSSKGNEESSLYIVSFAKNI